jgi:hypothetical protein
MAANERLTLIIDSKTTGTEAINQLSAALNKIVESASRAGAAAGDSAKKAEDSAKKAGDAYKSLGATIESSIRNPLEAAANAAKNFLTAMGPVGIGLSAGAAAAVAFGVAAYSAEKSLASLGTQTENLALRTGLTNKQVGEFTFAAKAAGSEVGVFESAMRKLSQGLADGGKEGDKVREGLKALGVQAHDINGELKPSAEIFAQIATGLNGMHNAFERNAAIVKVFGRGGVELIPVMMSLNQNITRARELGFGLDDATVARFKEYQKQITESEAIWDRLVRKFKEPLAATMYVSLKWATGPTATGAMGMLDFPAQMLFGGRPSAGDEEMRETGGWGYGATMSRRGHRIDQIDIARASQSILADRSRYGGTLEGAQFELSQAKEKADALRTEYFGLADGAGVAAARAKKAEWAAAESAVTNLTERVKILGKEEAKRVEILERLRQLIAEGATAYVIGSGQNTTIVPGQQLAAANMPGRTPPSLFGSGNPNNPYFATQMALSALSAPDYKQGLQVIGGEMAFVSPSSERVNPAQDAWMKSLASGYLEEASKGQSEQVSRISAISGYGQRIAELTGTGGEANAARAVAALREAALQREFTITGDIAKYRESSLQNELDLTLKIAEVQQRQKEQYEQMAGSLFDAIHGRTTNQYWKQFALGQERTLFSNAAGIPLKAAGNLLGGIIPNTGPLGTLLHGTIFDSANADPAKQTATNTADTVKAVRDLQKDLRSLNGAPTDASSTAIPDLFNLPMSGTARSAGSILFGNGGLLGTGAVPTLGAGAGIGTSLFNAGNGSGFGQFMSGLGGLGSNPLAAVFTGMSTNGSTVTQLTGAQQAGAGVAMAAMLAGAGMSIASGIRHGGVGGIGQAAATAMGTAGALLGPTPVGIGLDIAAAATGIISSLFSSGPAQRSAKIAEMISANQYLAPTALNVTQGMNGTYEDFDARGNLRTSNFSAVPTVAEPYITSRVVNGQRTYYDAPGSVTAPFSSRGNGQPPQTIINVHATDPQSFADFVQRNNHAIGAAVISHLQGGSGERLADAIRYHANG